MKRLAVVVDRTPQPRWLLRTPGDHVGLCSSPSAWYEGGEVRPGNKRMDAAALMLAAALWPGMKFGDLERRILRTGHDHSAEDWSLVLEPVTDRYRERGVDINFRTDAAFTRPEVYEFLEGEEIRYARLPANQMLQGRIGHLLTRPVGRHARGSRRSCVESSAKGCRARRKCCWVKAQSRGFAQPRGSLQLLRPCLRFGMSRFGSPHPGDPGSESPIGIAGGTK